MKSKRSKFYEEDAIKCLGPAGGDRNAAARASVALSHQAAIQGDLVVIKWLYATGMLDPRREARLA